MNVRFPQNRIKFSSLLLKRAKHSETRLTARTAGVHTFFGQWVCLVLKYFYFSSLEKSLSQNLDQNLLNRATIKMMQESFTGQCLNCGVAKWQHIPWMRAAAEKTMEGSLDHLMKVWEKHSRPFYRKHKSCPGKICLMGFYFYYLCSLLPPGKSSWLELCNLCDGVTQIVIKAAIKVPQLWAEGFFSSDPALITVSNIIQKK